MMKRIVAIIASLAVVFAPLALPAQASVPDGRVACSGGGWFKISGGQVVVKTTPESNEPNNRCVGTAVIPEGVTAIGGRGFQGATEMTDIVIPDSVTSIGEDALSDTGLRRVILPSTLQTLSQGALFFNSALTELIIPASVRSIALNVLFNSPNLCNIYFLNRNASTVDISDGAFNGVCGGQINAAKAWVPDGATGYGALGSTFKRLRVESGASVVLYDANGADSGAVPATATTASGTVFPMPGNVGNPNLARANFRFLGWCTSKVDDGSGVCYAPGTNFTTPGGTTILYANWQGRPKVTYDGNGATGGSVPVDASSPYAESSSVTVLGVGSLVRAGFTFDGWKRSSDESNASVQAGATFNIGTSNATLRAQWTPNVNTVTYNTSGGSSVSPGTFTTSGTIPVAPSDPTRAGFSFIGWVVTGSSTVISFPYSPLATSDISLTATWGQTYAVTYVSNGGSSVVNGSFPSGGRVVSAPTPPTRSGFSFAGWVATNSSTVITFPYSPGVTSDIELYATWLRDYVITYDSNGGSSVVSGSFPSGGQVVSAPTPPTRSGFSFAGWVSTNSSQVIAFPYSPGVLNDIELYATWLRDYVITYDSNGGTPVVNGSFPASGQVSSVPTPPTRSGFTFAGWAITNSSVVIVFPFTPRVNADVTLYAIWTANPPPENTAPSVREPVARFSVTYLANGSTSGSAPVDTRSSYRAGSTVEVLPNSGGLTKDGFIFIGWNTSPDGKGTNYVAGAGAFTMPASQVDLYAHWEPAAVVPTPIPAPEKPTIPAPEKIIKQVSSPLLKMRFPDAKAVMNVAYKAKLKALVKKHGAGATYEICGGVGAVSGLTTEQRMNMAKKRNAVIAELMSDLGVSKKQLLFKTKLFPSGFPESTVVARQKKSS